MAQGRPPVDAEVREQLASQLPSPRRPRRDALLNRERVLAAAASAISGGGRKIPLAAVAKEAGVGVATLYRSYADRDELLRALEHRAYGLLIEILEDIGGQAGSGLDAIKAFLGRTVAVAEQLVLPLHGAPP